ncbi:MAG: hypothetical protein ACO2ZT_05550 [Pontimonas sp.]
MNDSTRNPRGLRWVLRTGASVFGLSAIVLLLSPGVFLDLLELPNSADQQWSMRMIAITLVALTGNMAVVSFSAGPSGVIAAATVMLVSAGALGFLTLIVPATITWFTVLYALVGFGFSAAYLVGLALWLRPAR